MPAQEASLRITDAYQQRMRALSTAAERLAVTDWQAMVSVDDLDGTHPRFVQILATGLAALQAASVRLTAAYAASYLTSELRKPTQPPRIDEAAYVGVSRTGKTLAETLVPTVITTKMAIKAGTPPLDAAHQGLEQAKRLAGTETMHTGRAALADVIATDDRIVAWRRVTHGGCGACLAAATHTYHKHEPLQVHDGCRCTSEPIIRGVPDTARRPDGHDLFNGMTREQQDKLLGPDKAELIRSGQAPLRDLIAISPMAVIPDQITEAPLKDIQAQVA